MKGLDAPKAGLFSQSTIELSESYGLQITNISFMPTSNKLMQHTPGYHMKAILHIKIWYRRI